VQINPENAVVFRGSNALCCEYSLMFEARGIAHDMELRDQQWVLTVDPQALAKAEEEIRRYSAERSVARPQAIPMQPFGGGWIGGCAFIIILLLVAYAAGLQLFGADWFTLGAVDASPVHRQVWRALTAITLHLDQLHLMGNVFAGLVVGAAASRLLGPGVAWGAALAAAGAGNYLEMWIAPPTHRSIGASSLVFAALGVVTGVAWSHRLALRERRWYRWAPMIIGASLLTLFGAGGERVDVLAHLLGFVFGTGAGAALAAAQIPRDHAVRTQWLWGTGAVLSLGLAWFLALHAAPT
jgi:rhomboid protease GluP